MSRKKISVDDLFSRQGELRVASRATIKPEPDGRVTVTPVVPGEKCTCPQSITINRTEIAAVVPTKDIRDCCGRRLIVVEVFFKCATVTEIFKQLSQAPGEVPPCVWRSPTLPLPPPARSTARPPLFRNCECAHQYCKNSCMWWGGSVENQGACHHGD